MLVGFARNSGAGGLIYLFYNLCLWLASPLLLLWTCYRKLAGKLPGLSERLGFFRGELASGNGAVVWLHAVSLGEARVAGFLASELRSRIPALRVVFTSSTRTGYEEARRRAAPGDLVLFPPLDYRWICRRFLRRLQPNLVVILETELWPNLFRETKRAGAGLLLINGRISDRAFPRYRASRPLWRGVLSYPEAIFVQSARDAERFTAIGAPVGRVRVSGNLKFAVPPSESPLTDALRGAIRGDTRVLALHPVLIAGSTMAGEEPLVLQAFAALRREFPRLLLILAPRHPERCAAVADEVRALGIPCQMRSAWHTDQPLESGVFLLDSTGELAALYSLATAAFIGGTLVPAGGHNILEPAYFACPTLIGPSMENFREIADRFLEAADAVVIPSGGNSIRAGAVIQVENAAGLTTALRYLFLNPGYAQRLGAAGRDLLQSEVSGVAPLLREIEGRVIAKLPGPQNAAVISHPATASASQVK